MYNYNLNFTVERQLSATWSISSSYVGNLGRRLLNATEGNAAIYDATATTKNIDARRPLAPLYTAMFAYTSDANSAYHGWQTILTKRVSHGLSVLGHFTWSKSIDSCVGGGEVINQCGQQDPGSRKGSRGISDYDHARSATLTYLYSVPFFRGAPAVAQKVFAGWQLSGIHKFQTGAPFNVITGSDVALTGVGYDRPDVLHTPAINDRGSKQSWLSNWFDTTAFTSNQKGRYGNEGRNILRATGQVTWDVSVQKSFPLFRERQRLQFRTDFLNIMNHMNFDAPGNSLAAPKTLGVISSGSGGRVIQVALRAQF